MHTGHDHSTKAIISHFKTRHWSLPRWLIITIAVLLIIIAGLGIWLAGKGNKTPATTTWAVVDITEAGFSPVTIKIKKGQTVTWINKDIKQHQVAADPHPTGETLLSLKGEEPLTQNETYTAVFETSGTYTYHDYLDPVGFQATVIVE